MAGALTKFAAVAGPPWLVGRPLESRRRSMSAQAVGALLLLVFASFAQAATPDGTVAAMEAASRVSGAYRAADGALVVVGRSEDAGFVFDESDGRRRRVLSASPAGALVVEDGVVSVDRNQVLTATFGQRRIRAQHVPLSVETVTWKSGDLVLSGSLWRPLGRQPTPAVVLVQGSGPETRWAMRQFPAWLAANGLTVIAFDKRARWEPWESGIDVLAADVLGAVALLRSRPDVDSGQVGLLGISNGAFVAVRAAGRSSDVGFVIPIVGGAGPVWAHELRRVHLNGENAGLPANELSALDKFMRGLYRPDSFVSGRQAQFAAALAEARGTRWVEVSPVSPFLGLPPQVSFGIGKEAWERELSYDPSADLTKLAARPSLFILAGKDENVDTALAQREVALHALDARVVVLPDASHSLTVASTDASVTLAPQLFLELRQFVGGLARTHSGERRSGHL